jgi:hypothetical protein
MSGNNSNAENKETIATINGAACKILGREQASTHRRPHQCPCCTKAGIVSVM